ncbi:MAG: class I SAM-dependent methyltransferase [Rhodocyclaceae bacterium]|nr:class I SAM-dependent methyltransferase [Rhodocyclaceae bacterium]
MTERWHTYFDSSGAFSQDWLKAAVAHWQFNETLYGMIARHCAPPARILDVGCGPGWSDLYLSALGYQVVGIDNEPRLVDLANRQSRMLGCGTRFEVAEAADLSRHYGRYDLAYSCGVLEHFDREITVRLLQEQAKCARQVLIQVPTRYTAYAAAITDERIYSIDQLAAIVRDAGLRVAAKFGYGDLAATRAHRILRNALPRALWRLLQNRGYAFSIAVIGVP